MTAIEQLTTTMRMFALDDIGRAEAEKQCREAEQEQAELVKALRELEWCRHLPEYDGPGSVFSCCPECEREDFRGHKEGCSLAALLSRYA